MGLIVIRTESGHPTDLGAHRCGTERCVSPGGSEPARRTAEDVQIEVGLKRVEVASQRLCVDVRFFG